MPKIESNKYIHGKDIKHNSIIPSTLVQHILNKKSFRGVLLSWKHLKSTHSSVTIKNTKNNVV